MMAVRVPTTVGVNVTVTVQFSFAASIVPFLQIPTPLARLTKSPPGRVTIPSVKALVPVLDTWKLPATATPTRDDPRSKLGTTDKMAISTGSGSGVPPPGVPLPGASGVPPPGATTVPPAFIPDTGRRMMFEFVAKTVPQAASSILAKSVFFIVVRLKVVCPVRRACSRYSVKSKKLRFFENIKQNN